MRPDEDVGRHLAHGSIPGGDSSHFIAIKQGLHLFLPITVTIHNCI